MKKRRDDELRPEPFLFDLKKYGAVPIKTDYDHSIARVLLVTTCCRLIRWRGELTLVILGDIRYEQ